MKPAHNISIDPEINFGEHIYSFNGAILHHGKYIDHGHFTVVLEKDGSWWHINDSECFGITSVPSMLTEIAGGERFTSSILQYKKQ